MVQDLNGMDQTIRSGEKESMVSPGRAAKAFRRLRTHPLRAFGFDFGPDLF